MLLEDSSAIVSTPPRGHRRERVALPQERLRPEQAQKIQITSRHGLIIPRYDAAKLRI